MNNSKYAVVITFSFDPQVSVLLFDTDREAMNFIKNNVVDKWKIDTQENGWDSEYQIYETEGRAVLTTNRNSDSYITELKIGTVFQVNEVEETDERFKSWR